MLRDLEDLPDPRESTERVDGVVRDSIVDPLVAARFVYVDMVLAGLGKVAALELDCVRGGTVVGTSAVEGNVVALIEGDEDVK